MAVTSNRKIIIEFSGDVQYTQDFDAPTNPQSPGQNQILSLDAGDNEVIPPPGVSAFTFIPPVGNLVEFALKGDPADVGFSIAFDSITSIALPSGAAFFIAASDSVDVRIIFN